MKIFKLFVLVSLFTSTASFAATPVCGLLIHDSPGASLSIHYFLRYSTGTAPEDQHKVELLAGNQKVQKFFSESYNRSAVCVVGTQQGNAVKVSQIKNYNVGLPRVGRSN